MAASISTAPSAPAAIRARFSRRPTARSSASTATRPRSRSAPISRAADGRLTLVEDRFSNLDDVAREAAATMRSTASCSTSASPRCSSTRPSAASRSASTARSTCAWAARGRAPPTSSRRQRARSRQYHLHARRGAFSRPVARAIVRARAEAPIDTTTRARRHRRFRGAHKLNDIHPATRTFQALRIFVNDELGELAAALVAAEQCSSPAAGWRSVSFHSLEDRIVKTFLAARRHAAAARAMRRKSSARPELHRADEEANRRRRGGNRAQPPLPLRQIARRRAYRCARASRRGAGLPAAPAVARRRA